MTRLPRPRFALFALFAWLVCGCAYYNGMYNAKSAARRGDKDMRAGEEYEAAGKYRQSAATAETVLVRHPKTRWRAEALYLAGRGFALAGECGPGLRRLEQYLAIPGEPADRRDRAEIARGSCLFVTNQLAPAAEVLRPLVERADHGIRTEAALWAGRTALQLGDAERAQTLLATVPGTAAVWEFMAAAFARGDLVRAESLLVSRARAGDWRSEVPRHVRTLWEGGHAAGALSVADLYGRSRAPTQERVRLHFLASDLAVASGDTAQARRQIIAAQGLGVAAAVDAEARVRLLALRIRELDNLADVEAAIVRDSARARGTALLTRMRDHVTRVRLFLGGMNPGGVGVFLAAEVVRDSLHAYHLAHAMLRSIVTDYPDLPMAGRALLAASRIFPESTAVYEARIRAQWPNTGGALPLTGGDSARVSMVQEDRVLRRAWDFVARQWDDTLKARRMADSVAASQGIRRQ